MNYDLLIQRLGLVILVQAIRYLIFEQATISALWRRFHAVPVLGTFLQCAFCQGFWVGVAAFWIFTNDAFTAAIWGLICAWLAATWDKLTSRRKTLDNDDVSDDTSSKKTIKTINYEADCPEITHDSNSDTVALLECNIDDMSGEFFADVMERLFAAGALDVWFVPVYGKKNRPLYQLSVLVPQELEQAAVYIILEHSSTAGIRRRLTQRIIMERSFVNVRVKGEAVSVKRLEYADIVKFSPEWADCAAVARKLNMTAAEVYNMAINLAK
jgi:hypothetical protein